jgi:hypothetical protein
MPQCENYLEVTGPEIDLRRLESTLYAHVLGEDCMTLSGRVGRCAGAVIVNFPTSLFPNLDALAALADRFRELTFILIYYEVAGGLRGYAIYGPDRAWRTCQEEHVPLASEPQLFPSHYPQLVTGKYWMNEQQTRLKPAAVTPR